MHTVPPNVVIVECKHWGTPVTQTVVQGSAGKHVHLDRPAIPKRELLLGLDLVSRTHRGCERTAIRAPAMRLEGRPRSRDSRHDDTPGPSQPSSAPLAGPPTRRQGWLPIAVMAGWLVAWLAPDRDPGWSGSRPGWLAGLPDRVLAGWLAHTSGWLAPPTLGLAGSSPSWLAGSRPVLLTPLVGFLPSLSLIPPAAISVGPAGVEPATKGL